MFMFTVQKFFFSFPRTRNSLIIEILFSKYVLYIWYFLNIIIYLRFKSVNPSYYSWVLKIILYRRKINKGIWYRMYKYESWILPDQERNYEVDHLTWLPPLYGKLASLTHQFRLSEDPSGVFHANSQCVRWYFDAYYTHWLESVIAGS